MRLGCRWISFVACLLVFTPGCGKQGDKQGDSEKHPSGKGTSVSGDNKQGGNGGGGDAEPAAPSRGPERVVFSLVDNRLLAHPQHAGGLLVAAGSAGFPKYMRFGRSKLNWKIRGKKDGKPVATMSGKTGRLLLPLSKAQAAGTPTIRLRVHSDGPQRLGLRLNGKRDKEVTAQVSEAGWSTVEVTATEGALAAGENEILMFAGKKPLSIEWIQVGGTAAPAEAPQVYSSENKALRLPKGGGLAYYMAVPDKGRLAGDVSTGCSIEVIARDTDGKAVKGSIKGKGSAVELGGMAGKAVRLELIAAGCDEAQLTNAAVVVPGKTPELKRDSAPKHIVLLVIDSLRADRLKPINENARPEVPTFDDLATKAAFFNVGYVQGNESRASHASLWSSTYPVKHRMIPGRGNNPGRVDKKWTTIDEVTKAAGFWNSGVSANGYITPKRGFGTKWDKYRNHIHDGGGLKAENLLSKVWEGIAGKEKEKWFSYIGFIDTHVSWRAKQPWMAKYGVPGYKGRFRTIASGNDIGAVAGGKLKVSDTDKKQISALYDSNVSYQDQQLGELLKKLEELGIADDTMLIITADHGDELFEDGRVGHGASLKETLVHVPLIVHYPPLFPPGKRLEGAEVVDIVPTIADVLGAEMDEEWQGESLLPIAQGIRAGYPQLAFASKYEDTHVGRMGGWKLRAPGAGRGKLYNVESDPFEKKDLAKDRFVERRMVADALWLMRAYNREWRKWKWGNAANHRPAFAADMGE